MDAIDQYQDCNTVLAVIDNRTCLREAMSSALRSLDVFSVIEAESADSLSSQPISTCLDTNDASNQCVLLYCCGTKTITEINADLEHIKSAFHQARIVLLVDHISPVYLNLFDQYQLAGLVLSSLTTLQLKNCILLIKTGVHFLPVDARGSNRTGSTRAAECNLDDLEIELTPRQKEVFSYVVLGKSNKYIAAELSLCESTVKVHVHDLMKRLGATSRTHATYLVSRMANAAKLTQCDTT